MNKSTFNFRWYARRGEEEMAHTWNTIEHPGIHPEDFMVAMNVKISKHVPSFEKTNQFLMDVFLDLLAPHPPGTWTETQAICLGKMLNDPWFGFWFSQRFARMISKGRRGVVFNYKELLILRNWREVRGEGRVLPGLHKWKIDAAARLLTQITGEVVSGNAYSTSLSRLGLQPDKTKTVSVKFEKGTYFFAVEE